MDNETHLGIPAVDAQGLFSSSSPSAGRMEWVRTVGILAIEGKYATAAQPARAVLENFHQHFSAFMNLVESAQLFFTIPHHVSHCRNLLGVLCHPTAQDGLLLLTECAPFCPRIVATLCSTRRAARPHLIP